MFFGNGSTASLNYTGLKGICGPAHIELSSTDLELATG